MLVLNDHDCMISDFLEADCANCLGLCCIGYSFQVGENYAFDKPMFVHCSNLTEDYRCCIHEQLSAKGMHGCIAYNCFGAGQRSCQRVDADVDWHKRPDAAKILFQVFFKLKDLHQVMWLLSKLVILCPDPSLKAKIEERVAEIYAWGAESDAIISSLDVPTLTKHDYVWVELVRKARERYGV